MRYILTCIRAYGNLDALDECLQGACSQKAPDGAIHLIAVFDASDHSNDIVRVVDYWAASYGRNLIYIRANGLAQLHEMIRVRVGAQCLDYATFLDESHAPQAGWLQAMYDAAQASGADAVEGSFLQYVPWDSLPKLIGGPHDRAVFNSNTIVRAAWLRDNWTSLPRWGFAGLGAVTIYTRWPALSWRAAWLCGWRLRHGAPRHYGMLLAQLGRGLMRLMIAPTVVSSQARAYLMVRALGELGEVAGLICGRGR